MFTKSIVAFVVCAGVWVANNGNDDLAGIKCLINGDNNAKVESSAPHHDGEVYFCCEGCKSKFEANPAEFETKANHQLVLTGQYVQKTCPISGHDMNEEFTADVGGATVGFCCGDCQKKVDGGADLAAKATMVFGKEAFEKGFAKKKPEYALTDVKCFLMPKRGVSAEHAVDYRDGKVFFCCKGCPKKFAKDTSKFATQANHQLVTTGQYIQKACPFSGSEIDEEQSSEVGGVEVKYCCGNCKSKVESAPDDEAKANLVFSEKAFENGFSKK